MDGLGYVRLGKDSICKDKDIYSRVNSTEKPYYKTIIDYLNKKASKNYKYTTKKTKTHINARINEGFTIDDFKKVIDNKAEEWLNDSKMNKFLRPETLFGNKFESYLNQKGSEYVGKFGNEIQFKPPGRNEENPSTGDELNEKIKELGLV